MWHESTINNAKRVTYHSKGKSKQTRKIMESVSDKGSMSKIYQVLIELNSDETAQF